MIATYYVTFGDISFVMMTYTTFYWRTCSSSAAPRSSL